MPGLKAVLIFTANAFLLILSWVYHILARGDEYLLIFVLPLVVIAAAYLLDLRLLALVIFGNFLFFVFYNAIGVLDTVDVITLTGLLTACGSISYMVTKLADKFLEYDKSSISRKEKEYTAIVQKLESVEQKARIIEREFARVSRLYEITEQLGSVLRFDDLWQSLFEFLEANFNFTAAHLLIFSNGEFSKGISKSVAPKEVPSSEIDYKRLVKHMQERDYRPFYVEREDAGNFFEAIGIKADTFLAFPLFVKKISAVLAVEGATKIGYDRFSLVVPQISLELRKVELYEQVERLSIIDGLTGVYLRRYMVDRLREEVDRARRLHLTFSVGMVDIDHFKKCNDRYGHLAGDAVLREVAEKLKASVREVDMVARYGGEEFCIVLPETTKESAFTVLERLRKSIEFTEIRAFDVIINVTVSAGISSYPADARGADSLIEAADTALYKAKRKGRNKVCVL